jgi:hypothetical protein
VSDFRRVPTFLQTVASLLDIDVREMVQIHEECRKKCRFVIFRNKRLYRHKFWDGFKHLGSKAQYVLS